MQRQTKLFYLGIAAVIVILYLVLAVFFVSSNSKTASIPKQVITTPPTHTAVPKPTIAITPPLQVAQMKAKQGTPLTPKEQTIRQTLIASADQFGYIHTEPTFSIVYLKDYDTFQLRLLTSDLNQAKQNALNYLIAQGLSQNGICKLPVIFYTNNHSGTTITLNPNYCQ